MESAWGIGVVVGGLALSAWGGFKRKPVTSLVGLFFMGIALVIIGVSPPSAFRLAALMFFVGGVANPMVNGPLFAIVQSVVLPEMQGRVFTLMGSASSAMTPLGLIIAGPLADHLGVQSWFIAGGIITALLGLGAFFIPTILNIEDDMDRQAKPAP
jgi:DHA3 family macrolide efflux protein-like MFS transporter